MGDNWVAYNAILDSMPTESSSSLGGGSGSESILRWPAPVLDLPTARGPSLVLVAEDDETA
jgi:hypothetical protein